MGQPTDARRRFSCAGLVAGPPAELALEPVACYHDLRASWARATFDGKLPHT